MAYKNFFYDFTSLEKQFFNDNALETPSDVSLATFKALKNFLYSFVWTKSENTKFIVNNMSLDSEQMATLYNSQASAKGKKPKSSSTFRVQKANVSKTLYSMFGNDYRDAFYSIDLMEHGIQDKKLRRIRVAINLFQSDCNNLYHLNLPSSIKAGVNKKEYTTKECEAEIIFISRCTNLGLLNEISELDTDKLNYVLGILNDSIYIGDSINNKKMDLLDSITLCAENMAYTRKNMRNRLLLLKANQK